MNNGQKEYLISEVRKRLENGDNITIYGWRWYVYGVLKKYEDTGRILFVLGDEKRVPLGNYLIHTQFVDHASLAKFDAEGVLRYKHPLDANDIKSILKECADLIVKKKSCIGSSVWSVEDSVRVVEVEEVSLIDTIIKLDHEIKGENMSLEQKFAVKFLEVAKKDPDGKVSQHEVGNIRRELGIKKSTAAFVNADFILGQKTPGKQKVGWYIAKDKLRALAEQAQEQAPADPFEKIKWVIENKPTHQQKIQELQAEIEKYQRLVTLAERMEASSDEISELLTVDKPASGE